MRVSTRIVRLLPAGTLALCAAAFAVGGSAQAHQVSDDPCRGCPPPGPDKCLVIIYPDGSTLTCYQIRMPPDVDFVGSAAGTATAGGSE